VLAFRALFQIINLKKQHKMDFNPNQKQKEAFKKVEKAIKDAKKSGLVFYGKSACLVAYTKQADKYIDENGFENCFGNMCSQIPCISENGLINDSGADDYPQFMTKSDEERYS
jgi:hypothetical protein